MDGTLKTALDIRYIKLHFSAAFAGAAVLPKNKTSALRGGLGEMLLRANCVRNRECESCDFQGECIVQRIMYSQFQQKPKFVTNGESVGYIMDCADAREYFEQGEIMEFQLTLFGKTIVYFNQIMQALYQLGRHGIGKEHAVFDIIAVRNTKKQPLLERNDIYMERCEVETVASYVEHRMEHLNRRADAMFSATFQTPLTLKYRNEFLQEFQMEPILRGIKRRIFMLDCFENIDGEDFYYRGTEVPVLVEQKSYPRSVKRVSFRKNRKIILKGIQGCVTFTEVGSEALQLLLAGELIHVGKNTSFGFGRYRIREVDG